MNARRGRTEHCRFYLPDPWNHDSKTYPNYLEKFIALPRYYSKNYLAPSKYKIFCKGVKTLSIMLHPRNIIDSFFSGLASFPTIINNGMNVHSLFIAYEIFSANYFLSYKKRLKPQFSILFLNLLAHCQHNFWLKEGWHPALKSALIVTDKLLKDIFNCLERNEALLVVNGLSQKNVDGNGHCIYRQIHHEKFLKTFNIRFESVEPFMSNDCNIYFSDRRDLEDAYMKLTSLTLKGKPLLYVESHPGESDRIFYQFDFWERIEPNCIINLDGEEYPFFSLIELLCERTGSHMPNGVVYSYNMQMPTSMYNHKIFDSIINYFH
jgi:hypothetical protein